MACNQIIGPETLYSYLLYGAVTCPGDTNFDDPGKEAICNLEVDYPIAPICDTDLGADPFRRR